MKPILLLKMSLLAGGFLLPGLTVSHGGEEGSTDRELREVIVSHTDENGILQLYRMKEDGSASNQLTHSHRGCRMPACSPDGRKLVFVEQTGHGLSLWLSDLDGKNAKALVEDGRNLVPSWLPDSKHIVWMSTQPGQDPSRNSQIHLMNTETGESRRLFTDPEQLNFSNSMPVVSPKGDRIAFVSNRSGDMRIWVSDLEGGNAKLISLPEVEYHEAIKAPIEQKVPAWSPDGKWIAHWEGVEMVHLSKFTGARNPERDRMISATFHVWVVGSDGKNRRKVGRGDDPTWSPDGFVTRAFPDPQRGGPKVMIETESGERELPIVPHNRNWGRFTWLSREATSPLSEQRAGVQAAKPVGGEELLVNGDFEIGTPEDDKPDSFACKGWRRLLWKETEPNSWLTCGERDWQVGKDNQALEYRWGATSICQFFSAKAGETYQFSVEYLNPGSSDGRWQPRIQVQWRDANDEAIGHVVTVSEADYATAPVKTWNQLGGRAVAPPQTAYGRVLLNVNDKGSGQYFQKTYLDNASVRGVPGVHNLPVTFISSPYDLRLKTIDESSPFIDSLTKYADDKDQERLTFTRISGPTWLTVQPDGTLSGTPRFEDAGDNRLVVEVDDGRGSSETRTLTIPVIGFLRLGNLFDDDMVLQRNAPIPVWGTAPANQSVRVRMSTGESASTVADEHGNWSVALPAMGATVSGSITMSVASGSRQILLQNLLVGDVWFCSGQSNMSWPLIHTDNSEREIASARYPNLRLLQTPETRSATRWEELAARAAWRPCSPDTVSDFSAVAYYFGKKLQSDLGIPIGLINSSQGGTRIENWAVDLLPDGSDTFYNSRVHPYTRMPIKGAIWYQAEANIADGHAYTGKMQNLVSGWRRAWGGGEFPFYFVQLAPFNYRGDAVYQLPELWAAQTAAMRLIPNSGMVVTNDVGNVDNIHPTNKAPVGQRLALWAMRGTYGQRDCMHTGPMVRRVTREGNQLRITFEHVGSGLASRDGQPLTWFEVAGADKTFVPATATIDGTSLVVTAAQVPKPQWLRFAWHETAEPNLMNEEGLPANSFMRQCDEAF